MSTLAKPIEAPGLRHAISHGALWTMGAAVCVKVFALVSQFGLGYLLAPAEFGIVGLVLAVAASVSLLSGSHVGTVLVQRRDNFESMAGQAFWLALSLNTFAALLLAGLAPLAARGYGEPRMVPLLLLIAAVIPVMALPTIYSASLSKDLRFADISRITLVNGFLQNISALAFAWLGMGPYALVLPIVLTALTAAWMYPKAAGRIPLPAPAPVLWPPLLAAASWVMLNSLFMTARGFGPNLVVGAIARDAEVIGFFHWGSTLAFQAIFLLSASLQNVFFPTLARLNNEPERQMAAFRKAAQVLGYVAGLICVAQVFLAGPLLEFFFHGKWTRAVPVIQWLSLSVMTQPLNTLGSALLLARGEFKLMAGINALSALLVLAGAAGGAWLGGETRIACGTALATLVGNALPAIACFHTAGFSVGSLFKDLGLLLAVGTFAAAGGWLALLLCGSFTSSTLVLILFTSAALLVGYFCAGGALMRSTLKELLRLARTFSNTLLQKARAS